MGVNAGSKGGLPPKVDLDFLGAGFWVPGLGLGLGRRAPRSKRLVV
jgi:hypothetical protein